MAATEPEKSQVEILKAGWARDWVGRIERLVLELREMGLDATFTCRSQLEPPAHGASVTIYIKGPDAL